ncbi:hypothetical protein [Saccharicrinis aurantiacus]|uniref:hypothetical protein n=1 Tax=Saccharicrinis aurantiacus TaxID=1849719 RepID=UPI0024900820|nr:hypothetical protein [Saccharicrinis aurantiacus]
MTTYSLISLFVTYNYNSPSAYTFIVQYINSKALSNDNKGIDVSILIQFEKNISQMMENKQFRYTKGHDSLKENILNWLKTEITYFKEHGNTLAINIEPNFKLPKIETNLSVPQIACFLRQLMESNIIQSKTKKDTLNIFAQILTSTSSSEISGNSLLKKYYDIDDHSAKVVKELLLNLYNSFNAAKLKK